MAQSIREADAKCLLRHTCSFSARMKQYSSIQFNSTVQYTNECVSISPETNIEELETKVLWLKKCPLVLKPDVLMKRRGKSGLVFVNLTWEECKAQLNKLRGSEFTMDNLTGVLTHFIVEPFFKHDVETNEFYVNMQTLPEGDVVLFYHKGGVDIGHVESKAESIFIPVEETPDAEIYFNAMQNNAFIDRFIPLCKHVENPVIREKMPNFLYDLYKSFCKMHFAYLEINPFSYDAENEQFVILDTAGKVDHTADFLCAKEWQDLDFPTPFGRALTPEEEYIRELDAKTGASLKLTVLNPQGRIWTMVAGGGASVVYADTICDLGYAHELANYGEYSGAPSEMTTFEYSKTILSLITAPNTFVEGGKVLLIGGGIANFTSVADTFRGIIRALKLYSQKLIEYKVRIFVRRGGPSYQDGLKLMRQVGEELGLEMQVFGPETYITHIVPMAIQVLEADSTVSIGDQSKDNPVEENEKYCNDTMNGLNHCQDTQMQHSHTSNQSTTSTLSNTPNRDNASKPSMAKKEMTSPEMGNMLQEYELFTKNTKCIVWGLQTRAVQEMLDFDHVCGRSVPSVGAIVYEFSISHLRPFYFGTEEIFLPVCATLKEAIEKCPKATVLINFASMRSAAPITFQIMQNKSMQEKSMDEKSMQNKSMDEKSMQSKSMDEKSMQNKSMQDAMMDQMNNTVQNNINTIAVIAEGVPERFARQMCKFAKSKSITLIGPATVGGMQPGVFRIGNTGGSLENIMNAKLYRPGSVGFVTKSGGMLNELNNILSTCTDGTFEGIAIGGDRFPGTSMLDHLLRFEKNPKIQILLILGEVGGTLEYDIVNALKEKKITKPLVAWCVGTCAQMFATPVAFGHAGAWASAQSEYATMKNKALADAGAIVPNSFQELGETLKHVYAKACQNGKIVNMSSKMMSNSMSQNTMCMMSMNGEENVPRVPVDYYWAKKLGLVRKPKGFVSTISDDRGEELLYAGWPISKVLQSDLGCIGGVISLLWFKRPMAEYCYRYLETVLMLTADHGPAVCGAHNVIVTSRAGKDLISSLISGLCTIGDRFGGACDLAAQQFLEAYTQKKTPEEFVAHMKSQNKLIMGIGHRIKSIHNPDMRVEILKKFCQTHFPATPLIEYALEVEKLTTRKKDTLILNVDGLIGVSMCDLLFHCGFFSETEAKDYIDNGCINGLFVLGRSIGFIGHFLDQKRLKQGLYRHDADDIAYVLPELNQ